MARSYVPDAGDIVRISFSPQAGHEQAGHRTAVVLSPDSSGKVRRLLRSSLRLRRRQGRARSRGSLRSRLTAAWAAGKRGCASRLA